MSIAQPSVAGEGESHPRTVENQSADTQARLEFTCDTTNLPWVIFRAAHRAAHLDGLTSRARAVLAALARTVDAKRPYAAIFARRELLTGRAMQSMRTFYRSLDDLETAGLITRPPQNRYGQAGLFGRAYLHLTESATVLLGLVAPPTSAHGYPTKGQVEAAQEHRTDPVLQPSANVADGAIYKDLFPASQKRQPGALPSDLDRLTSLGFNKFFVFKLMAEARDNGKRLSDVVESCWHSLKKAVAPVPYLRSLLHRPVDFSYQARQRQADNDNKAHADKEQGELMQTLRSAAGQTFIDPANGLLIEIGEDGTNALVRYPEESRPRSAVGSWMLDIARGIKAGQIQLPDDSTKCAPLIGSHLPCRETVHTRGEGSDTNTSRTHMMQMREMLKSSRRAFATVG
ncbi:Replication protein O [Paraburkholderia caledonica]